MASTPRQWLDFTVLYTLFLAARPLPRTWLLAIGRGLGSLVWYVFRFRRGVVLDNLRQAFGAELDEAAIRDQARRFYRNLGMSLMEFLGLPSLSHDDLFGLVDIEGKEHFDAVLKDGRGAILVTGHFGNFEYLGARLAAEGVTMSFLAKAQRNARVTTLQNRIRENLGVGSPGSTKAMIRALRSRELVGMLADQNAGPDGLLLPFLGRPAYVFRGPAYLAWKLDVPILTGFIYRRPDGGHVIRADPPVYPDRDLPEDQAVLALTEYHV